MKFPHVAEQHRLRGVQARARSKTSLGIHVANAPAMRKCFLTLVIVGQTACVVRQPLAPSRRVAMIVTGAAALAGGIALVAAKNEPKDVWEVVGMFNERFLRLSLGLGLIGAGTGSWAVPEWPQPQPPPQPEPASTPSFIYVHAVSSVDVPIEFAADTVSVRWAQQARDLAANQRCSAARQPMTGISIRNAEYHRHLVATAVIGICAGR